MTAEIIHATFNDMNTPKVTSYDSPLRRDQTAQTRARILDAVEALFVEAPDSVLSFDEVGARAGVDRRTVFRHFPSKDALLDAVWERIGERIGQDHWPNSPADLIEMPPRVFASLESIAGIVRAAHVSAPGRDMRLRQNATRRVHFEHSLVPLLTNVPETRRREAEAVIQLLFSATAFQTMTDYWAMTGREAGNAVAWAIGALLDDLRRNADTKVQSAMKGETTMRSAIHHMPATKGRTLWVLGDRVTVKETLPGTDLIAAEVMVPPGSGTPLHTHASPETFHVLEGTVSFTDTAEGAPRTYGLSVGDIVTVPASAPHGYRNESGIPARLFVLFEPSLLAFFEAVGGPNPPPPGPPPADAIARVMTVAAEHGIRIVAA